MRKLLWIASAIIIYISACTKIESTTIGTGLIPPIDGVNTLDTFLDVYVKNELDSNSKFTKVYKSDDQVIGVINNDPVFGKTVASAFFELKPTYFPYALVGASQKRDSVVLVLSYRGSYGDTTITSPNQTWEVKEVTQLMQADTIFDVRKTFTTGAVLGTANIVPRKLSDSVNYGLENAKNQIRIKLSDAFADKLIKSYDSAHEYKSDSLFRANFKGFAVAPASSSSGNALIRVNLLDTNTKLAVYYSYKEKDTSTTDIHTVNYFRFSAGTSSEVSASANNIVRTYAGEVLASTANDSVAFLQTNPGTITTLTIPGLSGLSNRIIHRAEIAALQILPNGSTDTKFEAPSLLLLSQYDTALRLKTSLPNDFLLNNGEPNFLSFGGYYFTRNVAGKDLRAYTFDLSRYVQGIVTRGDANRTLLLSAPTHDSLKYTTPYPFNSTSSTFFLSPSLANQVAIGGVKIAGLDASGKPVRMRMRIIYSRL